MSIFMHVRCYTTRPIIQQGVTTLVTRDIISHVTWVWTYATWPWYNSACRPNWKKIVQKRFCSMLTTSHLRIRYDDAHLFRSVDQVVDDRWIDRWRQTSRLVNNLDDDVDRLSRRNLSKLGRHKRHDVTRRALRYRSSRHFRHVIAIAAPRSSSSLSRLNDSAHRSLTFVYAVCMYVCMHGLGLGHQSNSSNMVSA